MLDFQNRKAKFTQDNNRGKFMFKEIKNTNSKYLISEEGVVFSKFMNRAMKTNVRKVSYTGYEKVGFWVDGKKIYHDVHRLVATYFIPNPENKPQVNHKDGNGLNNHVSNLEWVTQEENFQHAYDNGYLRPHRGEKSSTAKLTEAHVREIHQRRKDGETLINLSKEFGVSEGTICKICRGSRWVHLGLEPLKSRYNLNYEAAPQGVYVEKSRMEVN